MNTRPLISIAVLAVLTACQGVPTYYDIGVVDRTVTTDSAEAQLWFNRGLALSRPRSRRPKSKKAEPRRFALSSRTP